ncbi:MAG TPA: hypothetical protein VG898_03250, partial [Solirubrobacterales bacterium]|nr:hypothetical protein [Solirubrobacterales bacterium]
MRRAAPLFLALAAMLALAGSAGAAGWRSEQPLAAAIGVPAPVGPVGDIECWRANRCLLITAGNDAMPAGLYAYDGVDWRLYSTVCGGTQGRIAWAGPDEFWTVSDQRLGQETIARAPNRSLCHFRDGQVVASYAEPLGQPGSYLQMKAAACSGPNDCWFAGERLPGTINAGAFHLHWDGQSLRAIPSLSEAQGLEDPPRAVAGLVSQGGQFYESVQAAEDDGEIPAEEPEPSFLHRIDPGSTTPFVRLFPAQPLAFGSKEPWALGPFRFAADGERLWALAGANPGRVATATLVHLQDGEITQVPLSGVFQPGDQVSSFAAEPGSDYSWAAFRRSGDPEGPSLARLARVHADGTVDGEVQLPEPTEGIARKGSAGPTTCPAAGQCWMATERGWLFHLGPKLARDTDPAMHTLIAYRPPDNSVPPLPPIELPADDSGAYLPPEEFPTAGKGERPTRRKARALVVRLRRKMIHGTVLQLSFTLRARARVRLIAKRRARVVARTRPYLMERGRRTLRLRLDPKRWPTGLALQARALHQGLSSSFALGVPPAAEPPVPAGGQGSVTPAAAALGGGASTSPGVVAQLQAGAPAATFFGASPGEAPGEVWGRVGSTIIRYTDGADWEEIPPPVDGAGNPVSLAAGTLAGRATAAGGIAVLAGEQSGAKTLVVRDPGDPFRVPPPPDPGLLLPGESLYGQGLGAQLIAPVEAGDGVVGAFVVPTVSGQDADKKARVQTGVLHFDGAAWTREDICLDETPATCAQGPVNGSGFKVLAIDADGPENAWLLVRKSAPAVDGLVLFKREGGQWRQHSLEGSPFAAAKPIAGVEVAPRANAQPLTVTADGVWVDATVTLRAPALARVEKVDATIYYNRGVGAVTGAWCDVPADASETAGGLCTFSLGSDLPAGEGRSFAWPGAGEFGRRTITGVGQGAMLVLEGDEFARVATVGGDTGTNRGAALSAPEEGWLGSAKGPVHLTRNPEPSRLLSWPVPFRRPLTAVAPQPGAPVGALSSEALGVGDNGEVARYLPGQGWAAEPLLDAAGTRATPRLRGVAWPEAGRAHAVGDRGAMWLWRAATGLWEPDPAKPPNLIRGNFTGVAFDPTDPERGYAVGQQGLLLGYGRQWTQEPLPAGVDPEANITSIAFAGDEALAVWRMPFANGCCSVGGYTGGLLVNDGSGWRVDQGFAAALEKFDYPQRVAGLPDGGAVIATGAGRAIERDGAGAPWVPVAGRALGFPAAVAAIREGGQVRAVISAQAGDNGGVSDEDQVTNRPPPGQPALITDPYPLPDGGVIWRQTAAGWRGEQQPIYPSFSSPAAGQGEFFDLPLRLDPVLALLLGPDGRQGWALGGETGTAALTTFEEGAIQTAAVMRYSADAGAPGAGSIPITATPGQVSLAVGGNAQCAGPCADLAGTGIGPDVWLPAAVARAGGIAGVRAFLYTGPGVAAGEHEAVGADNRLGKKLGPSAFALEERAYARRLSSRAGTLPVFAAATATDRDRANSLTAFASAFSAVSPVGAGDLARGYYSFDSSGAEGTVRVVVLDYSLPTLGKEQSCWLAEQLGSAQGAGEPAIVLGNRDLSGQVTSSDLHPIGPAADAATTTQILVTGSPPEDLGCELTQPPASASAYFFDFPEQNRTFQLSSGGRSIPAFGSGTLGQVGVPGPNERDFVGAAGFLLVSIDANPQHRDPVTNIAPVSARLIPSIEDLALDATDGVLLRRSKPALFEALARRPRAGMRCRASLGAELCSVSASSLASDPYLPIPSKCQGARCATALFPEYSFTSSDPDIADFVKVDPASLNPRSVLLGKNDKPISDPHSGLLCAFNAGTATVTVKAGGLAYSQKVTVQAGSVQRPCGTVPLRNPPSRQPQLAAPP